MSDDPDHELRVERARALERMAMRLLAKELLGRRDASAAERARAQALLKELSQEEGR